MKVIENKTKFDKRKIDCRHCDSKLEISESDLSINQFNTCIIICPLCHSESSITTTDFIKQKIKLRVKQEKEKPLTDKVEEPTNKKTFVEKLYLKVIS